MISLRPYQKELCLDIQEALWPHDGSEGVRAVCAVLPTGGGKTVCFSQMALSFHRAGHRLCAGAHREELVDQMSAKFFDFDVPHGIIKSGLPISHQAYIQCAMIQTLAGKVHQLPPPDVLVIDECHHTPASQYQKIIDAMPTTTKIIGFTATPERLDGKGLGNVYDRLVVGPQVPELISMGYLVPATVFAPALVDTSSLHTRMGDFDKTEVAQLMDEPTITGDAVEHYKRLASGTSAVAFCVGIAHAVHVAECFNTAGIAASHIDGGMAKPQRKAILERFRSGDILVLTSADLISEGFDLPRIETAILLRPTKSLGLYLQQVGRALRVQNGKRRAVILDHVQNSLRHGLPDEHREWCLDGKTKKKKKEEEEFAVQTCNVCFRVYKGKKCPDCLVEQLTGEKPINRINVQDGVLVEVQSSRKWLSKEEIVLLRQCMTEHDLAEFAKSVDVTFEVAKNVLIKSARDYAELRHVGQVLRYKSGWAQARWQATGGYHNMKPDVDNA